MITALLFAAAVALPANIDYPAGWTREHITGQFEAPTDPPYVPAPETFPTPEPDPDVEPPLIKIPGADRVPREGRGAA